MSYVPIVTPTTPQPPSPRTRELAGLLTKVMEEYRVAHPSVSDAEVREAVRLAQAATGGNKALVALTLSLGIGLLAAGLLAFFLFARSGGGVELEGSMPMVVLAVILFVGVLAVAAKAASR